jgi:hypothetical protein
MTLPFDFSILRVSEMLILRRMSFPGSTWEKYFWEGRGEKFLLVSEVTTGLWQEQSLMPINFMSRLVYKRVIEWL